MTKNAQATRADRIPPAPDKPPSDHAIGVGDTLAGQNSDAGSNDSLTGTAGDDTIAFGNGSGQGESLGGRGVEAAGEHTGSAPGALADSTVNDILARREADRATAGKADHELSEEEQIKRGFLWTDQMTSRGRVVSYTQFGAGSSGTSTTEIVLNPAKATDPDADAARQQLRDRFGLV